MEKLLYKPTAFSELICYTDYAIHTSDDPKFYYIGRSMGRVADTATFFFPRALYNDGKILWMGAEPLVVSENIKFKRIIYKKEQKETYRAAFEKRAVNQIVASIIGHAGNYY